MLVPTDGVQVGFRVSCWLWVQLCMGVTGEGAGRHEEFSKGFSGGRFMAITITKDHSIGAPITQGFENAAASHIQTRIGGLS